MTEETKDWRGEKPDCFDKGPDTDPFGWFNAKCVFCAFNCAWAKKFMEEEA